MGHLLKSTLGRASLGLLALLAVGLIFAPLTFSAGVWLGMMPFIGILGIAALGQHIVIQQRGFDLSVGGIMSVCAVLISSQLAADASTGMVILFAILVLVFGAFIGMINGVIVSYLKVPPLVTTIGTNTIMIGLALQLSGGVPSASPQGLISVTSARLLGIPLPFILMILVTIVAVIVMNRTSIGRRFIAVGVSPAASTALAISVPRYQLATYALAGALFAGAGLLLAGVLASPAVHSGTNYMLATLAAVVIGSNPLNGDKGSVLATIFGAIFLTYLNQLVLILGFDYAVQNIVQAVIVLAGVAIPTVLARRFSGTPSVAVAKEHAPTEANPNAVMRLKNLAKSFGPVQALTHVSLDVLPGEIHAIVGENGAGKSTLINLIVGVHRPTSGSITLQGKSVAGLNTAQMRKLGVAVAYQHPALPPHLSVQECLQLVSTDFNGDDGYARAQSLLERVATGTLVVDPSDSIENLNIAQRHAVETARAVASNPKVLILDEPTEPFQEADVKKLFAFLNEERARGTAIIYISHRLHEVEEIADRISVLRDGELIETRLTADFTHEQIIASIVGRSLEQVFPAKTGADDNAAAVLKVNGLTGSRYSGVSFDVHAGEILGLAGVEGQGQRDFLRALTGLGDIRSGTVEIAGVPLMALTTSSTRAVGLRFVPDDRHAEGIFGSLSIRENITLGQLDQLAPSGILSTSGEVKLAEATRERLRVRSPNIEVPMANLSGGNQQKVLFGREVASQPSVLIVDEPTKGVDIGSRSDIYHQLREMAAQGVAVIVASSDGIELEGLCDRVMVFSRGQVVDQLTDDRVTDAQIIASNLQSTASREASTAETTPKAANRLARFMGPTAILAIIIAVLTLAVYSVNPKFLSPGSLRIIAIFGGALALISASQFLCVIVGEIDLSVGPLSGLVVVLASFLLPEDSGLGMLGLGLIGILLICAFIGLLQGLAIFWLDLPAMVVTLATFFGFQGLSLLLRPTPEGYISEVPGDFLSSSLMGVPVIAIVVVVALIAFDYILKHRSIGRAVRALGSDRGSAFRLGVRKGVLGPLVFMVAAVLTGLGGLVLASEVGIGSASSGTNFTIMSITAVVLGGTLIGGGRGSFVAILLGALLIQVMAASSTFLRLGAEWQNWQVGLATLLAASLFSIMRNRQSVG